MLLEKFCGISSAALPLIDGQDFDEPELISAVSCRSKRYPLQYILGEWYFFGEKYIVNENCLVPRPDTEILVEKAISELPENAIFADLCTGSGCIAISVLAHRKDCRAFAVELFESTLDIAIKNAELNGVSDRFTPVLADVLKPIKLDVPIDAIVSNPPYIPTEVVKGLEDEVQMEPKAALDGGVDGLDFYRAILKNHLHLLKKDGFAAFEIGYDQGASLKSLALEHSMSAHIIPDYGGNDRVAFLKFEH